MTDHYRITAEQAQGVRDGTHRFNPATGQVEKAGELSSDGLREIQTTDRVGRTISTFESVDGKKRWMDPFKTPRYLQTALGKDPAWNRAVHRETMDRFEAAGMLVDGQVRL